MQFIYPEWNAPKNIKAATTLITSGLNLALTNTERQQDEKKLIDLLALPAKPFWLQQIHSNVVIKVDNSTDFKIRSKRSKADASIAYLQDGMAVCAVLHADCLPILLTNLAGTKIAAIHAGWRGMLSGIIEATVKELSESAENILAWLGPAISKEVYEVGKDVYEQAVDILPTSLKQLQEEKWLFDLLAVARSKLHKLGITQSQIYGGKWCTYSSPDLFHSYRLNKTSQRMATLIWFTN